MQLIKVAYLSGVQDIVVSLCATWIKGYFIGSIRNVGIREVREIHVFVYGAEK